MTGRYWISKTNGLKAEGFYDFDENGKMIVEEEPEEPPVDTSKTGIYTEDGVMYYYENGVKTYAGLIVIDGGYYYVNSSFKVVTGRYWISKTNDLMVAGFYDFDENGKMIVEEEPEEPPIDTSKTGIYTEDGVMYYYENGVKTYAGLIVIDGGYYYVNSSFKVVTGRYWISKTNGLMVAGFYDFDENGRMIMG